MQNEKRFITLNYLFRKGYEKHFSISIIALAMLAISSCVTSKANKKMNTIIINQQGSFAVGGSIKKEPGVFYVNNALKPEGQTFHGDHAYVFYQIPDKAKKYPLVFLHGAGQSKQTWETTPDGRDGFQNIFLRRGYSVYLLDQPRRGEAGRSTVKTNIEPVADEQFWFTQFRLGNFPDYFPNVQFPKDTASLEQFFRHMTPNTGVFDANVISDATSELFTKIGEGILITHSQGGGPGWLTAIKNKNIKAVIAYEPFSGFVFPKGELPPPIKSASLFGDLNSVEISMQDFKRLTEIPIIVYYGDNIATTPTNVWNKDHWRAGLEMAKIWAAKINEHGGDAKVVHLPEIGIYGNTHFMFSDLNNVQVADQLSQFLKDKGLDK
jgi:pimeloyl-ACP methyl ester carboxylesterase